MKDAVKKERLVAGLLVVAALGAVAFALVYAAFGAQTQLEGIALGIAFMALAAALVVWEHGLMRHEDSVEDRGSLPSGSEQRSAARDAFGEGTRAIEGRRPWLVRVLAAAGGVVGISLLFPLRSLTPTLGSKLQHTSWRAGSRLVREDGTLVHASDLDVNSVLTVFPEGHVGPDDVDAMANDATMLLKVPAHALPTADAATQGLLAFSKVCTHAGCPVALYRASAHELFCPCHQSTFDVLHGAVPIFGPAARALPQLPIRIADGGVLEATGDFPEPIGPGYWERA